MPNRTGIVSDIREDLAFGLGTLPTGEKRVDREKKIIRRVLMVGESSQNSHGVDDVTGTDYTFDALTRAKPLYEGIKGNVNHPDRDKPGADRDAYDRHCKYLNVTVERSAKNPELGNMYGDMHLIPSHKLTESLLDAAENEKLQDCYSSSHNAKGRGDVVGNRYVIRELPEARSVDTVADGGSGRGLLESKEQKKGKPMTKKFKIVLMESKLDPAIVRSLMEDDALMDMDAKEPEAGDSETAWKDDLVNAISKLVKGDDPECHAMAKKILKMLSPAVDIEEEEEEEEPEKKKKKDDDYMEESRKEARAMFELAGVKPTTALLESAAKMTNASERASFIKELKEAIGTKTTTKPPPGAPRKDATQPLDAAQSLNQLLSAPL